MEILASKNSNLIVLGPTNKKRRQIEIEWSLFKISMPLSLVHLTTIFIEGVFHGDTMHPNIPRLIRLPVFGESRTLPGLARKNSAFFGSANRN
jgi:hypothetical protein